MTILPVTPEMPPVIEIPEKSIAPLKSSTPFVPRSSAPSVTCGLVPENTTVLPLEPLAVTSASDTPGVSVSVIPVPLSLTGTGEPSAEPLAKLLLSPFQTVPRVTLPLRISIPDTAVLSANVIFKLSDLLAATAAANGDDTLYMPPATTPVLVDMAGFIVIIAFAVLTDSISLVNITALVGMFTGMKFHVPTFTLAAFAVKLSPADV